MAYNKTPNNEASELIEKVVYLNRVSKTVKGGRIMKFSALVVVGDGKGTVGYGLGKAAEVSEAILKGIADAKKNMVKVSLAGNTIPHDVIGIFGAGQGMKGHINSADERGSYVRLASATTEQRTANDLSPHTCHILPLCQVPSSRFAPVLLSRPAV